MPTQAEQEIYNFLGILFGDNEGQVYVPTKGASAKSFVRHFFSYPARKDDIVAHMIQANSNGLDCYIAPALFKTNENATKENWLGTQYLFVDFDGNAPKEIPPEIPEPTMRIRSSVQGREHWYWKLDKFYSGRDNRKLIEGIAKSITYSFDADKSGWDCVQVLRAPGTKHRKTGATTSLLKHESARVYKFENFKQILPAPSANIRLKTEEKNLPDPLAVLAKYTLSPVAQEIFNRDKRFMEQVNPETGQKHDRSKALFRFARECLEVRPKIPNESILSLLNHLAYKWGKFDDRSDRFIQVKIVLQNALALKEEKRVDDDANEEFLDLKFLTIEEMLARENTPFEWIYDEFLVRGTLNVLASLGGIGKTSLAMQLGMDMACSQKFLRYNYQQGEPLKSVLFSFEMPEQVFNNYAREILKHYDFENNPEWGELVRQNWKRSGLGYPVPLWDKKVQEYMAQQVDINNSQVVFIDSVKYAGGMDEKHGDLLFEWVKKELIAKRGITVYFIHHIRKPSSERPNHKPTGLEDLYGDAYIGNIADSVTFLHKGAGYENELDFIPVKTRHKQVPEHRIQRMNEPFRYYDVSGMDNVVSEGGKTSDGPEF